MGIAPDLNALLDQLRGVVVPENMSGEDAVNLVRVLLLIRGLSPSAVRPAPAGAATAAASDAAPSAAS